jgi:GntR family transcriptional repressor for pyruvate dehydrogenase complex
MTEFPPEKRRSKSAEITEQLLAQILSGAVGPGQRLPPERDLAARFETNRNTLREALRNLQTMNVLSARQGDGLHVLDYEAEGEINLLPHFLRHGRDPGQRLQVIADMLRLRRILLCEVSAFTALRGSESDKTRLQELLEQQRENRGQPEALILTDLELAMTMVRAGGSLAYQWIFNTMAQLFAEIAFQWPMLWVYPSNYVESLAGVIAHVVAGDAQGARQSMDEHLLKSDDVILEVLGKLEKLGPDPVGD